MDSNPVFAHNSAGTPSGPDSTARLALDASGLHENVIAKMAEGLLVIDHKGRLLESNPPARRIFHIEKPIENILDLRAHCNIYPEGAAKPLDANAGPLMAALEGETRPSTLYHVLAIDGSESSWIEANSFPLYNSGGKIVGAALICRDITRERHAVNRLEYGTAQFDAVLRSIPDIITKLNRDGCILAIKLSNALPDSITRDDFLGRRIVDLLPKETGAAAQRVLIQAFESKTTESFEWRTSVAGKIRDYEARVSRVDDDGAIAIIRDTTVMQRTRRDREAQTRELSELTHKATLSELVREMSHQLTQPLQAISFYAQGCIRRLPQDLDEGAELRETLEEVSDHALHAGSIIKRFREFLRIHVSPLSPGSLNDVASNVADAIGHEAQERGIQLHLELEEGLQLSEIDPPRLEQALLQLVRNALDASNAQPNPRIVTLRTANRDDGMVELSVSDCGVGISADQLEKIFDPFFTTKATGIGLGLAISNSILESHLGHFLIESPPGLGATVRMLIPVAEARQQERGRK